MLKYEKTDNASIKSKWLKISVFVLLLAFYASFLLHPIALPVGDDLPRLIKNGEMVFQNPDILTKNVYSYTEPDHSFANHHWLSGVLFYFLDKTVGFDGLVIFKIVILLASFTLLFLTALKKANFWLIAFFSIPTILILRERTLVRPEIFSYLLIAVYLYLIIDLEQHPQRKRIFWLVPLQLLWVNLHLFFGVGILMVAGFLFEKFRTRQKTPESKTLIKTLSILVLALIAVSLINPFGFKGALFALEVNIGKDFPVRILETRSLNEFLRQAPLWSDISVGLFQPLALVLVLSFLFSLEKRPVFFFLASAGTALLSFVLLRALPLFGMIFLLAITANLNEDFEAIRMWLGQKWLRREKLVKGGLIAALVTGTCYLILFLVPGNIPKYRNWDIGLAINSNGAADFFKQQGLKGPVFNDADIGSYLIYHLYPQEKVFVDNRFGDAYSTDFFKNTYLAALDKENRWHELEKIYGLNAIILYQYDQGVYFRRFLYNRTDDPAWALVYGDNYNVIYLKRNAQNQNVINKFEITPENAAEKLRHLLDSPDPGLQIAAADIMNLLRREDLAIEVFKRIVQTDPQRGRIWKVMGEATLLYIDEPDPTLAIEYLEKALAAGEKTADTYGFLGLAYYRAGNPAKAEQALTHALEINPDLPDARKLLDEVRTRQLRERVLNGI